MFAEQGESLKVSELLAPLQQYGLISIRDHSVVVKNEEAKEEPQVSDKWDDNDLSGALYL